MGRRGGATISDFFLQRWEKGEGARVVGRRGGEVSG